MASMRDERVVNKAGSGELVIEAGA